MTGSPPLRPPAWPAATDPPPADARCSRCGGSAWWSEATPPRFGWRCCCCTPAPRPVAEVLIVAADGGFDG